MLIKGLAGARNRAKFVFDGLHIVRCLPMSSTARWRLIDEGAASPLGLAARSPVLF
jgi:hypothetical protein